MIQVEHIMKVHEGTSAFKSRVIIDLIQHADLVLLNGEVIKDRTWDGFGIGDGKAPTRLIPDYTRILQLEGGRSYAWYMETPEYDWCHFAEHTRVSVLPAGAGSITNMRVPRGGP